MEEPNVSSDNSESTKSVAGEKNTNKNNTGVSKRELKRRARHERWLKIKPERRAQERELMKKKRKEKRALGLPLGENRKKLKSATMESSTCKIKVAVDMSFEHLMSDKDLVKTVKQVQNCYAANRRTHAPLQLYVTSFTKRSQEKLEIQHCQHWDVNFCAGSYLETFDRDSIVYLTSESPNVLERLEEEKVYIIGGLVDHNLHKGLCYKLAEENGVGHACLPINQYINMKTRKVLAINHVFQILAKWTEGNDWKEAFLSALPQRKGASSKEQSELTNSSENSETNDIETSHSKEQLDMTESTENSESNDTETTTNIENSVK